jgi:hypothetical protein
MNQTLSISELRIWWEKEKIKFSKEGQRIFEKFLAQKEFQLEVERIHDKLSKKEIG